MNRGSDELMTDKQMNYFPVPCSSVHLFISSSVPLFITCAWLINKQKHIL